MGGKFNLIFNRVLRHGSLKLRGASAKILAKHRERKAKREPPKEEQIRYETPIPPFIHFRGRLSSDVLFTKLFIAEVSSPHVGTNEHVWVLKKPTLRLGCLLDNSQDDQICLNKQTYPYTVWNTDVMTVQARWKDANGEPLTVEDGFGPHETVNPKLFDVKAMDRFMRFFRIAVAFFDDANCVHRCLSDPGRVGVSLFPSEPFSAASKPISAAEGSLCSIVQDLHD